MFRMWFTCETLCPCRQILACDLGLPAGLFMPNIFLGASLGALQGLGFKQLCLWMGMNGQAAQINTGLYALVGATSMLAGVFRSAISLVVIMLEGTGKTQFSYAHAMLHALWSHVYVVLNLDKLLSAWSEFYSWIAIQSLKAAVWC